MVEGVIEGVLIWGVLECNTRVLCDRMYAITGCVAWRGCVTRIIGGDGRRGSR